LIGRYPDRRPPIIEGLLRQGETMNLIAAPKVGKSWLSLGLPIAVATGEPWIGTFPTRRGKVLIIDNELHLETSAHRLRLMVQALNLPTALIGEAIHVVNLRGRLADLRQLGVGLKQIDRGRYALVIIDAFYRALPLGTDENSNAAVAELYNLLDTYADALGAGFTLIHHSSKGNQSAKSVTDVGAGAGAQSRAADTHVSLRPHADTPAGVGRPSRADGDGQPCDGVKGGAACLPGDQRT
jgi:RecA-family ATPase